MQVTQKRFETKTRTSNLGMRIDRAYRGPGYPNVPNRKEFSLPWSDIRQPDLLEHLDILASVGQPFALGLWKQETDVFDGDGETKTFYLQRRQLIYAPTGMIPTPQPPDYDTRIMVYDRSFLDSAAIKVEPLNVTQVAPGEIDDGDPYPDEVWIQSEGEQSGNLWRTKIRFGTAPAAATDNIVAIYMPLYTVVVDQEAPRSYAQSLVEPRQLKLVEFG